MKSDCDPPKTLKMKYAKKLKLLLSNDTGGVIVDNIYWFNHIKCGKRYVFEEIKRMCHDSQIGHQQKVGIQVGRSEKVGFYKGTFRAQTRYDRTFSQFFGTF